MNASQVWVGTSCVRLAMASSPNWASHTLRDVIWGLLLTPSLELDRMLHYRCRYDGTDRGVHFEQTGD